MNQASQVETIEGLNDKEVQSTVIKELREYRALKVKLENKIEREQEGLLLLFPVLQSPDKENELKVRQIDRAMNFSMDATERKIIQLKYLNTEELNDLNIYLELGLKKDKYYRKKRSALHHLATALGII